MSNQIKLTKGEAEAVQWAIDAMDESWCTPQGAHESGEEILHPSQLPILDGNILLLSVRADVNSDLHYRACYDSPCAASAESRAVRVAAQRIADSLNQKLVAAGVKPQY